MTMTFDLSPLATPDDPVTGPAPDPVPKDGALARKLRHHVPLSPEECAALDRVLKRNVRQLRNKALLIEEGVAPNEINVLLEGWACRYTHTADGRRRIVAFYIPGDVCDFDAFIMTAIDQSIAAIGTARIAGINRSALNELSRSEARISRGLWWESLTAAAIQRAWTINVGHRSASQRIGHLLCELHARLVMVGLVRDDRFALPLTQSDIGDACAMTAIHANRTLQDLRANGLITLQNGYLTIHEPRRLATESGFDPAYLQVKPPNAPDTKLAIVV